MTSEPVRTHGQIDPPIPHVVDRAARSAHDQRAEGEKGHVEERGGRGEVVDRRDHCD